MIKLENIDKIIAANWKLNGSRTFVENYLSEISIKDKNNDKNCVVICPPFPFLSKMKATNFYLGAQDCSSFEQGAYTGEVSAQIIKEFGCQFCIIGHSERRNVFNDNNDIISKKINNCIKNNIVPILCIGESLSQKKENLTEYILKEQIQKNLPRNIDANQFVIAYEPLWAIGTGLVPEMNDISKIHKYIKQKIFKNDNIKILYGGSVKATNYKNILNLEGVDGLLVGGASINLDEFNKIIEF